MALLVLLRHILGFELSLITVAAGHVMLCLPYALLVLMARLESFDASLEEAAFDLGDTPFRTFYRVTVPLAWPGIVSSCASLLQRLVRRIRACRVPLRQPRDAAGLHLQ